MNRLLQQKTLIAALMFAIAAFSIEAAVNTIEISTFSSEEDSSSSSEEESSSSSEEVSSSSVGSSSSSSNDEVSSSSSDTYRLRLALPIILIDASGNEIKNNKIFQNSSLLVIAGIYNSGTGVFDGNISVRLENDVNTEIIAEENATVPTNSQYYLFELYTSKINSASGDYKIGIYYTAENGERMISSYSSYQNPLDVHVADAASPIIAKDFSLAEIPKNASVQIYNLKGKLMTGTLPPGIYFVKIKGEKFNINRKIVVRP